MSRVIRAVQAELGVEADGRPGPETWSAIYERIVGDDASPAVESFDEPVDDRSERTLATLRPEVRPYARALVHRAAADGIRIRLISGLRSYEEQDALYAQGRSKPGPVVTKARAGYSSHNFGLAFDVGVFQGDQYLGESPGYAAVGAMGLDMGLVWGGTWIRFPDRPHFELRPEWADGMSGSRMLAALRERRESGRDFFA